MRRLPPYVFISVGFVAAAILLFLLSLLYFHDPTLLNTIAVPLLVGVFGSVVATLTLSLFAAMNAGLWSKYRIMRNHDEVYAEAKVSVKSVARSASPHLRDVQVTALVIKETKEDNARVIAYMAAMNDLLKAAAADDTIVYRLIGNFGEWVEENGRRRLVNYEEEAKERLAFFSEESQARVRLAAYQEVWPVDVLVLRDRTIIAFRDHSTGKLSWGLRVIDEKLAERARHWLDELWGDDRKAMLIWDGKKIRRE